MKESENLQKAKSCIDNIVKNWNKTNLSEIEKWAVEESIIWGVFDLGLYLLSQKDYQKLKDYTWQKYGYNPGGATGKYNEKDSIESEN